MNNLLGCTRENFNYIKIHKRFSSRLFSMGVPHIPDEDDEQFVICANYAEAHMAILRLGLSRRTENGFEVLTHEDLPEPVVYYYPNIEVEHKTIDSLEDSAETLRELSKIRRWERREVEIAFGNLYGTVGEIQDLLDLLTSYLNNLDRIRITKKIMESEEDER